MNTKPFTLSPLPPPPNVETIKILKQLAKSHKALAELKGIAQIIPNEDILTTTLMLREARESSAIENIITTQDDLYKAKLSDEFKNINTKEVENYEKALRLGYDTVKKDKLLLSKNIVEIQETLLQNQAGFRTQSGTTLQDPNGTTIYTPPQDKDTILNLMTNLEKFTNDKDFSYLDPLTKMAIIHYQFESIHPFYDGNGRVGRIINILYLVKQRLLDTPILYLSAYIIEHKKRYYDILQNVRDNDDWESMILYLLKGVESTAKETIEIIKLIQKLMLHFKSKIRDKNPKIYSQDLINNLFKHPYTKIGFLEYDLQISYDTSRRYLDTIVQMGLLQKRKIGKSNYYLNSDLIEILRWKK